MNATRLRSAIVSVLLAAGLAAAPIGAAEAGDEDADALRLSLGDCLRVALENNLDLIIQRKSPLISEQSVAIQDATFDPTLTARASMSEQVSEVFNPSDLNENTSQSLGTGLTQQLPFGAQYSVDLGASKFDASGPLFSIEAAYSAGLTMTYDMPLLQGLGREVTEEQLLVARTNLDISREDLRLQAHAVLLQVENAYWDLVSAREALEVARSSLKLAQDLYELNKKKVEVGTLAPIEITQAEAGVASREEGVILAETALLNAEDTLRRLLGYAQGDPAWNRTVLPTDEPSFAEKSIDLDAAVETALHRRPEVANARRTIEIRELGERSAQNGVRHRLDLSARVAPSGNNFVQDPGPDGILNTFDDRSVVDGSIGEAFSELPEFDNYDWRIGLNYTLPIGNKAAKANYRIATLERERAELTLVNLEQQIRVELRTAVRNVESGVKRVNAARANTVLQRKTLEAEQKKYENGMSTAFQVLEIQNNLSDAQFSEIRAVLEYTKALADLERAKGTLLEARGLTLE